METGSVITLTRGLVTTTLSKKTAATPQRGILGFIRTVGEAMDQSPPVTRQTHCFSLILQDNSRKNFVYMPNDTETEALQEAVNYAVGLGFFVEARTIALFASGKIDRLFFQKRKG